MALRHVFLSLLAARIVPLLTMSYLKLFTFKLLHGNAPDWWQQHVCNIVIAFHQMLLICYYLMVKIVCIIIEFLQ